MKLIDNRIEGAEAIHILEKRRKEISLDNPILHTLLQQVIQEIQVDTKLSPAKARPHS